jgi:predicted DNA-binding transcriptional regulator YafY
MSNEEIADLTQAQRDRLSFIELRLRFIGEIRRQDLVARFGIQAAAATRDIAQYREIAPRNLDYDSKGKVYVRGDWFRPAFEFSAERVLTWLSHGFGDGEPLRLKALVPCESPGLLSKPDLETLSVLTRAIHKKIAVEISYRALSSGLTTREIVPFALADDGLRWHVRAYDRRSGEFRDFVLTRIADARLVPGRPEEREMSDQDNQWSRIVELELVPHPANVQHPDTIEADYGMAGGVLRIRVRAALAGYLLRRWNVDCTENHSLKGAEFHLWLRNHLSLVDVANLSLAPGYVAPTRSTAS